MCQGVFDKNATKKPCVTVYKACETRTSCISGKVRHFMDKLPIDETRCSQWVNLLGKEYLAYVPIEKLHELKYICGIHFDPEDFNMKRNRLAMSSTPSNNLQCKPSSEEILVGFPCHVWQDEKCKDTDTTRRGNRGC